jgi:hypothetical protein
MTDTEALELARGLVHFVWFRGDEYHRARRIWGTPDFIHMGWDRRARREIAPVDVVIFARGPHDQMPADRNFNDIVEIAP